MYILITIGAAIISAAIAIIVYIAIHRAIMNGRKDEIIAKAENEAENIKKEKILQAKEKFLQLKSSHDQYVSEKNAQLNEGEQPCSAE